MPAFSIRIPRAAAGYPSTSAAARTSKCISYFCMPAMAEYDAEVSDDPLYVLRHSTAHVLAAAVTELFPGAKYAGGPPVENGFYYDFDTPRPPGEDDLKQIEKRMRQIVARGDRVEGEAVPHAEA